MARSLEDLVTRCKGAVSIECNPQRNNYETIEEYLMRNDVTDADRLRLSCNTNLWRAQFYPDTPVGHYDCYGATFYDVVGRAHEILDYET